MRPVRDLDWPPVVDQIHNRTQNWEGWPFHSLVDATEFVGELLAMVEEAAGVAPYLSSTITFEDRQYEAKSLGELREVAPTLDLHAMHDLKAMVFWGADAPRPVDATFRLEGGTYHRGTWLHVSGEKGTAVDGVNVGAGSAVERWAEKTGGWKEAEAGAMADRESPAEEIPRESPVEERREIPAEEIRETPVEERRGTPTSEPPGTKQPAWQRFLAHPYSIQIIGGSVAGLVVFLIAAIVFSQN
jgi:hypothetical protein